MDLVRNINDLLRQFGSYKCLQIKGNKTSISPVYLTTGAIKEIVQACPTYGTRC